MAQGTPESVRGPSDLGSESRDSARQNGGEVPGFPCDRCLVTRRARERGTNEWRACDRAGRDRSHPARRGGHGGSIGGTTGTSEVSSETSARYTGGGGPERGKLGPKMPRTPKHTRSVKQKQRNERTTNLKRKKDWKET